MDIYKYRSIDLSAERLYSDSPEKKLFFMHTHSQVELYCFISGKGIFHVEGSAYPLQPGDVLLMRPTEAHYIELDTSVPYDRIIINFDPALFANLDPEGHLLRPFYQRKSGKRNLHRAPQEPNRYLELLDQLFQNIENRPAIIARLILLLQVLREDFEAAVPDTSEQDTIEYRIIRYINKNLHEELTLQTLCDRFFISRAQLCRRFKKATGTSVAKYIGIKRLIASQQMITQGQKPTDVFGLLGYRDYSTFYRAYTAYFGYTPKEHPIPPQDGSEVARNNIG